MRKFWSGVAKFFAVIFCIVFVLTALLALVLNVADRRLLVSATYKTALARQQVYARLPRILAEQISLSMNYNPCASNPLLCKDPAPEFTDCAKQSLGNDRYTALLSGVDQPTDPEAQQLQACIDKYDPSLQSQQNTSNGAPAFFKNFSVSDMERLISALLPPADLKSLTENILDQTFAYLNGQQNSIVISLVDLKQRLAGPDGQQAILNLIRSQPACTDQQINDLVDYFTTGKGELQFCRPPEGTLTLLIPDIQTALQTAARQIPDSRVISPEPAGQPADFGRLGQGTPGALRFLRLIVRLSTDIPLIMLIFISLLGVRSPKGWLRWWGIPFLVTGLLSLGLGASSLASFEEAWLTFLASRLPPELSTGVITLGHDLLRAILQTYVMGLVFWGGLLGVLGLGMWIGSAFIKSRVQPAPEPAALPDPS